MVDLSYRKFTLILLMLCFAYLGFECWFNQYAMISVDEFWFAHRIFQYRDGIPYLDFSPYKTVLGYYLLLWPMTRAGDFISVLIFTKNAIALLNAVVLFLAATWLTKFFSRTSVLASLLALVCMEITLSFSTNIRVDLFAYWFCLFSLLCLLDKRYIWGGLLLGLGFATSQKAIWFWFASNIALSIHWLTIARDQRNLFSIIKFNVAVTSIIIGYLAWWSFMAGWHLVYNNVFVEASAMYHLDWYDAARRNFWRVIVTLNPFAFLVWPLSFVSLFITFKNDKQYGIRQFVIVYAYTILFCLMAYKQVFPYYMQVTLPVFLVLYAAFFNWIISYATCDSLKLIVNEKVIFSSLSVYILGIAATIYFLELPYAYLLVLALPALIGFHLSNQTSALTLLRSLTGVAVIMGAAFPFAMYTHKLLSLDSHYQKANLIAMHKMLEDGTDYTAGIELIYNKTQPIAGLRHLMGPAISYLYNPSEKLRPVMTSALYEDPNVTSASVQQALATSRVKFYVNNYRMHSLPPDLLNYLDQHYQHLWGSIYLYAPLIPAGNQKLALQFSGKYLVESHDAVTINHKVYASGAEINLLSGALTTNAKDNFRLRLIPNEKELILDPAFRNDQWEKIIF